MVIHINSFTFNGIEITDVDVQIQIAPGMPCFTIVGLADKTIAESRERVKAALLSLGLALPAKRIIINLAPADLIKEGSHFDLPIACGVLASMGILPPEEIAEYLIAGELSLDGKILPIAGILPAAIGANQRSKGLLCPERNGREAMWSGNNNILAASSLISVVNHFKGTQVMSTQEIADYDFHESTLDIADIQGQDAAKRVLEIAAAGEHNLLMSGPPGSGKSMLAQRLPSILPPMSPSEILECSTIASVAGLIEDGKLTSSRPFRAPHHSCSMAAMVGGGMGRRIKPGEISLAHNGVLFLDELPEFPSQVIDSLRQPLETGQVLISRSGAHISYPSKFQLVAAMNPCKCGYLGSTSQECGKAPKCGSEYRNKISGPILDRFDLTIDVPAFDFISHSKMNHNGVSSKEIRDRVMNARKIQAERFSGYGILTNARMDGQVLIDFATPSDGSINMLNDAAQKFKFSMRAYNRVLRVARTIADLDDVTNVTKIHIAEAISYRQMWFYIK
jgi:magnesium chelatase family protein